MALQRANVTAESRSAFLLLSLQPFFFAGRFSVLAYVDESMGGFENEGGCECVCGLFTPACPPRVVTALKEIPFHEFNIALMEQAMRSKS